MLETFHVGNNLIIAFMISYFPYFLLTKENICDKDYAKPRFILSFILISYFTIEFTNSIYNIENLSTYIPIINLTIIGICYSKDLKKAIISYTISYFMVRVIYILVEIITYPFIKPILKSDTDLMIIWVYIPCIILQLMVIFNVSKFESIYKYLSKDKKNILLCILVIISFEYIIHIWSYNNMIVETIFYNMMIITFIMIVNINIKYMTDLNLKCEEVSLLNKKLSEKNDELKKIKHDYGSQISYLNGLYIMNKRERLGELLKNIISGNENTTTYIKSISHGDSIISKVINSMDTGSIHIVIDEEADLSKVNISQVDIQNILLNIIKSSVDVLNKEGLIMIKTYKVFSTTYISIKNNSPKINCDYLISSYEKELSNINETINKNNVKIYIDSNKNYTEFKIVLK